MIDERSITTTTHLAVDNPFPIAHSRRSPTHLQTDFILDRALLAVTKCKYNMLVWLSGRALQYSVCEAAFFAAVAISPANEGTASVAALLSNDILKLSGS